MNLDIDLQVRTAEQPQAFNFTRIAMAAVCIAAVHILGSVTLVGIISPNYW